MLDDWNVYSLADELSTLHQRKYPMVEPDPRITTLSGIASSRAVNIRYKDEVSFEEELSISRRIT